MREKVISVTEAARNFADCVNRAHYQGMTFILQKNGIPVARIVPEERKESTGRSIAAALARVPLTDRLTDEEFAAWRHDLEEGRKMLLPADDKWQ
jgi:antitoxin (DNA-binding transcriptional repressor) of toxin-antitoxin stability system